MWLFIQVEDFSEIANKWKGMTEEQKAPYVAGCRAAKEKYLQELATWKLELERLGVLGKMHDLEKSINSFKMKLRLQE